MQTTPRRRGSKAILLLGSAITAFFWWIAWSKECPASQYAFFPLWGGYILTINGLSEYIYGRFPTQTARRRFFNIIYRICTILVVFRAAE